MKKFRALAKAYLTRTQDKANLERLLRGELSRAEIYAFACQEIDLTASPEERYSALADKELFGKKESDWAGNTNIRSQLSN